jgi:hypothetical protein
VAEALFELSGVPVPHDLVPALLLEPDQAALPVRAVVLPLARVLLFNPSLPFV